MGGDNQIPHYKTDGQCDLEIDARGLQCPGPIMKLKEGLDSLENNQTLNIKVSDFGFLEDAKTWTKCTNNTLEDIEVKDGIISATIRKTNDDKDALISCSTQTSCSDNNSKNRQTIVAFSNDFDKLMATFIIANGALSMNKPVSIFFTFWGLSALRKENFQGKSKKSFLDKMFSMMLPKGVNKTGLSKMNMGGLGAKMMRYTMNKKNVDALESLMNQFIDNGGKIIACTMSMDVMGITKEELIDGIEYGGVATYIGDAQDAYSNLFI